MNGTGVVECEVMGLPGRRKTGGRPFVPRAPISRVPERAAASQGPLRQGPLRRREGRGAGRAGGRVWRPELKINAKRHER